MTKELFKTIAGWVVMGALWVLVYTLLPKYIRISKLPFDEATIARHLILLYLSYLLVEYGVRKYFSDVENKICWWEVWGMIVLSALFIPMAILIPFTFIEDSTYFQYSDLAIIIIIGCSGGIYTAIRRINDNLSD